MVAEIDNIWRRRVATLARSYMQEEVRRQRVVKPKRALRDALRVMWGVFKHYEKPEYGFDEFKRQVTEL